MNHDGSNGNGSGEPSTRPKSYATLSTAEWQELYEKDGAVDLWLQEEFNSGSRLVVSGGAHKDGVLNGALREDASAGRG